MIDEAYSCTICEDYIDIRSRDGTLLGHLKKPAVGKGIRLFGEVYEYEMCSSSRMDGGRLHMELRFCVYADSDDGEPFRGLPSFREPGPTFFGESDLGMKEAA